MNNSTEIWKDITGYEGKYQVSSFGRVKSLSRTVNTWNAYKTLPERILTVGNNHGYQSVRLYSDGASKMFNVHRLVALAFLERPMNAQQVDHINGIKNDNRVINLRWVTAKENCNNPLRLAKFTGSNNPFYGKHHTNATREKIRLNGQRYYGKTNPAARSVVNLTTGEVFETLVAAGKSVNVSGNAIGNSIRRKTLSGGCQWQFLEERM